MENFNSNNTTSTTTFSHFGKNKLLFANNSWYGDPKSKTDWTFISNIHVKIVDAGGCVEWVPLYSIVYRKNWNGGIGWKLLTAEKNLKAIRKVDSLGAPGLWYETFLQALGAAKLDYLNISLEEGEYKVVNKSFITFSKKSVWKHMYDKYAVNSFFVEMPEYQKYPQLKQFKTAYRYDIYNDRPVYGDETVFDNYGASKIINALLDCDYKYAFDLIGHNRLGMTSEDLSLIWWASAYIDTPYYPYPDEPQYGYPIQMKAYDTIQKAIATAKRLYQVN